MNNTQLNELLKPEYMATQLLNVRERIRDHLQTYPKQSFDEFRFIKGSQKTLCEIDYIAETSFKSFIKSERIKFPGNELEVHGEESIQRERPNLRQSTKICVICDIIDGTDLLYRGFANWCSAVTVFNPAEQTVEGSYVAIESINEFTVYYALRGRRAAKLTHAPLAVARLQRASNSEAAGSWGLFTESKSVALSKAKALANTSLCVNAQKGSRFRQLLDLRQNGRFLAWLDHLGKQTGKFGRAFRFYNLAGNPMLARMVEGKIGVVMDLAGQLPHDVVPGAMIARGLDAVFGTPTGAPISEKEIVDSLCEPSSTRLQYVLAANKQLYDEVVALVQNSPPRPARSKRGRAKLNRKQDSGVHRRSRGRQRRIAAVARPRSAKRAR